MPLPTARVAVTSKVATLCPSLLLSDPKLIGSAHVHVCFSSTIMCPGRSPTSMLYLGSGLSHLSVPLTFVCPQTLTAASSVKHPANNTRVSINPPPAIKSCTNRLAMGNYRNPNTKCADNETLTYPKSNPHFPHCHTEPAAFCGRHEGSAFQAVAPLSSPIPSHSDGKEVSVVLRKPELALAYFRDDVVQVR